MGNDILNLTHRKDTYIPTKRLAYTKSTERIQWTTIESVFGRKEEQTLKKNYTVPCIITPVSIEEEEPTLVQNLSPLQESRTRTNTLTSREASSASSASSLVALQQEIKRLKQHIQIQAYNSRSYSPVKEQKQNIPSREVINQTATRNRKHYFKLKGCQPEEEEIQDEIGEGYP